MPSTANISYVFWERDMNSHLAMCDRDRYFVPLTRHTYSLGSQTEAHRTDDIDDIHSCRNQFWFIPSRVRLV